MALSVPLMIVALPPMALKEYLQKIIKINSRKCWPENNNKIGKHYEY
jgi:hypothetical protein